jgi:hypothetical protein
MHSPQGAFWGAFWGAQYGAVEGKAPGNNGCILGCRTNPPNPPLAYALASRLALANPNGPSGIEGGR